MINKKRLAMIAVAASMMLPTNLAYLSLATPVTVFAETTPTTDVNEAFGLATNTITKNADKTVYKLSGNQTYTLHQDLTLDVPLFIGDEAVINIDLNNHSITTNSADCIFWLWGENGKLTLTGTGTLTNNVTTQSKVIGVNQGSLTLDSNSEIKLESKSTENTSYGICIYESATTSTEINNATINAQNGIYVNGLLVPAKESTLELNDVKIDAKGHGIYQAGAITTNITGNDTVIKGGSVGIEVRAGTLDIEGGEVKGGSGTFTAVPNGNGSTTENAGIVIAQHTTQYSIDVEINNTEVEGNVALASVDPQKISETNGTQSITITVTDSELNGTLAAVATADGANSPDVSDTENTFTPNNTELKLKDLSKVDGVVINFAEEGPYTLKNDVCEPKISSVTINGLPLPNGCYDVSYENNTVLGGEGTVIIKAHPNGTVPYIGEVSTTFEISSEPAPETPSYTSSGSGGHKKPTKPAEPEEPTAPVATPTTMYRLYNKLNGEHLFTTDKAERDALLTSDTWKDEGQGWTAPSVSDYPVYRLLNPNTGDHHYTTDKNEFDTLPTYGWVAEGIAFFSADKNNTENVILHRLYNPNATGAGSHHYTADTNERDTLVAQGWKYEGTAWAGLPANK